MSTTTNLDRPWPNRTPNNLWGPHYRLALCNSADCSGLLIITESGLFVSENEKAAVSLPVTSTDHKRSFLIVGMARSDLPKELLSSWKIQWASFRTAAPWIEIEEEGKSSDDVQAYWRNWILDCSSGNIKAPTSRQSSSVCSYDNQRILISGSKLAEGHYSKCAVTKRVG